MSDRERLGHAVENGSVRFFSVSSLEKADPRSMGCYRRYYRRYVLGEREAENEQHQEQKQKGVDMHAEIAAYLRTGTTALSPMVLRGRNILPQPGDHLRLEYPLHKVVGGEVQSVLTADGTPLVGWIDCLDISAAIYAPDGSRDPINTVEVSDWKRKGKTKDRHNNSTLKAPTDLIRTIQMAGYGEACRRAMPGVEYVRLSLGYFPEREPAVKVTRLHVVDDCRRAWEYVDGLARNVKEIVRETDQEKVPPNTNACDAYGGCPYRGNCTGYQRTSLDNIWTKVAQDFKEIDMGLLPPDMMNTTFPLTPAAPPVAAPDMRATLMQEEAALRAQQAQVQEPSPPPPAPPTGDLRAAWQRLQGFNRGTPMLAGAAAQALGAAFGQQLGPGASYQGSGQLSQLTMSDPAHIFQLLAELEQRESQQHAPPVVVAPPPPPPLASGGLLPPDAPSSAPELAAQQPASPPPASAPEPEKRKPGRPKKTDSVAAAATTAAPATAPVAVPASPQPAVTQVASTVAATESTFSSGAIYIGCRPLGVTTIGLDTFIDRMNAELARRYCVDAQGRPTVQDVRCAPKESPLAYGGWKGAVHEIVRTSGLPEALRGADVHLDVRGDELKGIVADALRVWAEANNIRFVQGVM